MSKPARRILGLTLDGRPIYEPNASAPGMIYAAMGSGKTTCKRVGHGQPALDQVERASAAQLAQREDRVDTPVILDKIPSTLIEEPPGDNRNYYWRESPREFLHTAIRIVLALNSKMTSDDQLIGAETLDDDA